MAGCPGETAVSANSRRMALQAVHAVAGRSGYRRGRSASSRLRRPSLTTPGRCAHVPGPARKRCAAPNAHGWCVVRATRTRARLRWRPSATRPNSTWRWTTAATPSTRKSATASWHSSTLSLVRLPRPQATQPPWKAVSMLTIGVIGGVVGGPARAAQSSARPSGRAALSMSAPATTTCTASSR